MHHVVQYIFFLSVDSLERKVSLRVGKTSIKNFESFFFMMYQKISYTFDSTLFLWVVCNLIYTRHQGTFHKIRTRTSRGADVKKFHTNFTSGGRELADFVRIDFTIIFQSQRYFLPISGLYKSQRGWFATPMLQKMLRFTGREEGDQREFQSVTKEFSRKF